MKIAVLGAAGQLGRDLCPRLASLGDVIPLSRADIDLSRPEKVTPDALAAHAPDVFINCAAYNLVDKAEVEPEAALATNALGVRALAKACHAARVRFVHFSSDYVFGLHITRRLPLAETDAAGPESVYAASKLAGECFALSEALDALVIRTCGLYGVWGSGGKGGNFVETMLRVAGQGKPLRVVNDQHCTPSYTADVADATVQLIRNGTSGLFHIVNQGASTWYEFAAEIFRQVGLKPDLTPITSAEFNAPAKRPAYSVLATDKLVATGVTALRPWPEALAAYLVERQNKPAAK